MTGWGRLIALGLVPQDPASTLDTVLEVRRMCVEGGAVSGGLLERLSTPKLCLFLPCEKSLEMSNHLGSAGGFEEKGLEIGNHTPSLIHRMERYVSMPKEKAPEHIPLLFIAFPSSKDPTWEVRFPGRAGGPGKVGVGQGRPSSNNINMASYLQTDPQ